MMDILIVKISKACEKRKDNLMGEIFGPNMKRRKEATFVKYHKYY
jgi:hypothetical protein